MYIKNFKELVRDNLHEMVLQLVEHALTAADPWRAVVDNLRFTGNTLVIKDFAVGVEGGVHVVGFGKASKRMAMALHHVLGEKIKGGVVITPYEEGYVGKIRLVKGDHPIPRENTFKSSQMLIDYLVKNVGLDDLVIVLISGGGSALFEIPEEGVSMKDIAWISRELMKRGADIFELNAVRKRFSRVKGGKFLRFIKAKHVVSLIVSDVIGDRLDTIASGPTSPDETTFNDVYNTLVKYGLWNELSVEMKTLIDNGLKGKIEDTPKPGDPIFEKVRNIIVASNTIVLKSIARRAREMGFNTIVLTSMLEGEAKEVGRVLGSIIKSIYFHSLPVSKPVVVLAGGETVVTVMGKGIGGRNQELCLSLLLSIKGLQDIVAVCIGTDGIDGVSPAAGAIIDGSTYQEAISKGLNPRDFLNNNDSYTFFSKLKRTIITGYTDTNVNDVFIAVLK
jgi:glycerate 2-kinase